MAGGIPSLRHAPRSRARPKRPRSTAPAWSRAIWPGTAITGVGGTAAEGTVGGTARGAGGRPAGTGVGDLDGVVAAGAWDSAGVGVSAGPPGLHFGHGHPTTGTIRRHMLPMSRRLTSSIPTQDKKAPIGMWIHAIGAAMERQSHLRQRNFRAARLHRLAACNVLSFSQSFIFGQSQARLSNKKGAT